jgi:hypothetical protein
MCASINMVALQWDSFGVVVNSLVSIFLIALIVVFPVFIAFFYPLNFSKIYSR